MDPISDYVNGKLSLCGLTLARNDRVFVFFPTDRLEDYFNRIKFYDVFSPSDKEKEICLPERGGWFAKNFLMQALSGERGFRGLSDSELSTFVGDLTYPVIKRLRNDYGVRSFHTRQVPEN